jgi:hypothetical protein
MFNTINHLLYEDKGEITNELLDEFSPYMTTRYLSFYSEELLHYANNTLNKYSQIFDNDEDRFLFYRNVIPKLKRKKIKYLSKKKNNS